MPGPLDVEALLEEEEQNHLRAKEREKQKDRALKREHDDDSPRHGQRGRQGGSGRHPPPFRHDNRSRYRTESEERRERNGRKPDLFADRQRRGSNNFALSRSRSPPGNRKRSFDESGIDRYVPPGARHRQQERPRSRSPDDDRHYRPNRGRPGFDRRRERDYYPRQHYNRPRRPTPLGERRSTRTPEPPTPKVSDIETEKCSVFVRQLASSVRTRDFKEFFERVGPVKDAILVKDRQSNKSKGIGYIQFVSEESVQPALQLTGQRLDNIPVIVDLTEAEKNRQARPTGANGNTNSIPFHRIYVGNIHFSVTDEDIKSLFVPFGEIASVELQRTPDGVSRGYGFVQFVDAKDAKDALGEMNNFVVAGRQMRVGLGNDKFTPESTQTLLQKFNQHEGESNRNNAFQGSQFSGSGGRGAYAGGSGGAFDRSGGGRDEKKQAGNASALDDTDVTGVNFSNYSRDALMRKLARKEDGFNLDGKDELAKSRAKAMKPMGTLTATRCVLLKNVYDSKAEQGHAFVKELEEEVRDECAARYGQVVHISVDVNSPDGDIYVAFDSVKGGDNALKGLNGRIFAARMIAASPVNEAVYKARFPKAF